MIYNGTNITITLHANHNFDNPTTSRIYYKKPSGETGFWNATMSGNDNLVYVTSDTDIDIPGVWILQGYVLKSGTDYWTSLAEMIVEAHI
jgi:hypothetical protein